MTGLEQTIWWNLLDPIVMFFKPEKRVFWLFILSNLILVKLVSKISWQQIKQALASKNIWLSSSSQGDLKLIFSNALLRIFTTPLGVIGVAAGAAVVSQLWRLALGEPPHLLLPLWLIFSLFTLVSFVVDDFFRFLLHYWQHRSPLLWQFHRIHHNATRLTPLTLYRTHPVEIVMARMRDAVSYGLVTGTFFFFFGKEIGVIELFGINAFSFAFNALGANLRHSELWLTFGPFERMFISPAAHQIHHGKELKYHDKNFGACFAIWDKLWGCYLDPRMESPVTEWGVDEGHSDLITNRLTMLLIDPFKRAFSPRDSS